MCERVEGKVGCKETPIGNMPLVEEFDRSGLDVSDEDFAQLMEVDRAAYKTEMAGVEEYFAKFGDKVPARLKAQWEAQMSRLG